MLRAWCRELWLDLLALVWPTACAACGLPDRELCDPCREWLHEQYAEPREHDGLGVPCFVLGPYDGPLRAVLVAYKHGGIFAFSRVLGRLLVPPLRAACARAGDEALLIVTLPSRPRRVRERGYRHVDECVRVALRVGNLQGSMRRVLATTPGRTGQVGLATDARERNARRIAVRRAWAGRPGAIRLPSGTGKLSGTSVVLVDDIVTTGATMRAAIDVIERAGARVVAVVALCVTARRDTREKSLVVGSQ